MRQVAGDEYAREQSAFYTKVRTVADWFREFFLEQGAAADARRAQALPLIAQDGTRVPDLLFSGPDIPISTNAQSRFYGTEKAVAAAM